MSATATTAATSAHSTTPTTTCGSRPARSQRAPAGSSCTRRSRITTRGSTGSATGWSLAAGASSTTSSRRSRRRTRAGRSACSGIRRWTRARAWSPRWWARPLRARRAPRPPEPTRRRDARGRRRCGSSVSPAGRAASASCPPSPIKPASPAHAGQAATLHCRAVRVPTTAIRAAAVTALVAGVAAPLVRRRLELPPPVVTATAATAPFALCVLYPRTRARDAAACVLQMWAYIATYEMPNDDTEALERRARVAYPVRVDRFIGGGTTPTLRLQRRLGHPGGFRRWEKALVWSHWLWFLFPHGTVLYFLLRENERFPRAAAHIYATFDLGLIGYWAVPTAPPWYAAKAGLMDDGLTPELRRMMVEYGEQFWGSGWQALYGFLGGNPLAAMPSLHFATSVTAARLLVETGRTAGTLGWAYAGTLGVALVYLGEHYVVDLAAGLALAEAVRRGAPALAPVARGISGTVRRLEARASS